MIGFRPYFPIWLDVGIGFTISNIGAFEADSKVSTRIDGGGEHLVPIDIFQIEYLGFSLLFSDHWM